MTREVSSLKRKLLLMRYNILGKTGLKISCFSLGSLVTFSRMERQEVRNCVSFAYERGVNLFDTAEVYDAGEAEKRLGDALSQGVKPRDTYAVCSKVFWGGAKPTQMGLSRKHIIEACNASLKRLGVEYLDFYLCHRADRNTSIEEIVIAMNILIQQEKILYWGTSEWPPELIVEAYLTSKSMKLVPPSTEQFEYNLFRRNNGEKIIPALRERFSLGSMATMPLATGILAGKYNDLSESKGRRLISDKPYFKLLLESEQGKRNINKARQISKIALGVGLSPAQLSLVWCLRNRHIDTVILGVSDVKQLEENLAIVDLLSSNYKNDVLFEELEEIVDNKPNVDLEPTYQQVLSGS